MQITLNVESGKQINPDEFELEFKSQFGRAIRYYDDGIGGLWVFRDTMGIVGIVRAQDESSAYEIVEDEFLPVATMDDLPDCYGAYDRLRERMTGKGYADDLQLRKFCCEWAPAYFRIAGAEWELSEGYAYQSNATGTGIVSHDLNGEALNPLTPELAARLEVQIVVKLAK